MMHMTHLVTTTPIPGSDNWHTAVVAIGPDTAEDLLKGNVGNRKLSPGAVARYAAAMRKGDWKTSPEPLIFAPNGRLLNGQTRLHAIKSTGVPQRFLCVFGVSEDVFSVLDRGRPRSFADAHQVPKRVAEVARLLASVAYPPATGGSHVADHDFVRVLRVIEAAHTTLTDFCPSTAQYFSSSAFRAAAAARILSGEDVQFVLNLYRDLVLGHFDNLPPAGVAAARAVHTGRWGSKGGAGGQLLTLARGWSLFSEKGQHRTSIPVAQHTTYTSSVADVIRTAVTDAANV